MHEAFLGGNLPFPAFQPLRFGLHARRAKKHSQKLMPGSPLRTPAVNVHTLVDIPQAPGRKVEGPAGEDQVVCGTWSHPFSLHGVKKGRCRQERNTTRIRVVDHVSRGTAMRSACLGGLVAPSSS